MAALALLALLSLAALGADAAYIACIRSSYNRGIGTAVNTCPAGYGQREGSLCYIPCKAGYSVTNGLCAENCPKSFTQNGLNCIKPSKNAVCPDGFGELPGACSRPSYSRGTPQKVQTCPPWKDLTAYNLCYNKCPTTFDAYDNMCVQDACNQPGFGVQCGPFCVAQGECDQLAQNLGTSTSNLEALTARYLACYTVKSSADRCWQNYVKGVNLANFARSVRGNC
eukprot:TRINITY_DN631_c0_g1_i3.p1 TRINITY_DN631_c0_g1~~TRINITY_DN631_c0_g1_i3.p1  ORF type:complete len:225 (+),score=7.00 TRINITY_DN631_c0_g1_i3:78-752(+)